MTSGETHKGSCHCGAVTVTLTSSKPAAELRTRSCQCGFCRRRGTLTVSDPQGHALLQAASPDALVRYRLGLQTADYLLCRTCGTYVAAVQDDGGRQIAVINAAGLDIEAFRGRAGEPVSYDGEAAADRRARRRTYWMPIQFRIDGQ